jgi:hypothetical protein
MRTPVLLFVVSLLTAVLVAQAHLYHPDLVTPQSSTKLSQTRPDVWSSDGERMWSRAHIRVIPLDVVAANKTELESLRNRVSRAELDTWKLASSYPAIREQLYRQVELNRALLQYAERQDSEAGKSSAALQVQRHLNEIEGRRYCEACHAQVIAAP